MAVLRNLGQLPTKLLIRNDQCKLIVRGINDKIRQQFFENFDTMTYPVTKEDFQKSADKYGIHIDEYKCYPESQNVADYPLLPKISADFKDPYYPWDMPLLKRNYGEPFHLHFDFLTHERPTVYPREYISVKEAALVVLGIACTISILLLVFPHLNPPVLEKQFPRDGVHYTFEPATSC